MSSLLNLFTNSELNLKAFAVQLHSTTQHRSQFMRIINLLTLLLAAFILQPTIQAEVERIEKGNLVIEGIPEIPELIIERLQQYQNTRSAALRGWLNSEQGMLISTRFGETSQLHTLKLAGGARNQITFFNEPVRGATVCPDPDRNGFLFMKDIGGNESNQIYYYDLVSGSSTLLTDGTSRNGAPTWSNDGKRFAFTSTKRNGRDNDIYIIEMDKPTEATLLLEGNGYFGPIGFSPDDKQLSVFNYISASESHLFICDLESSKLSEINSSDTKISYGAGVWAKNDHGVFISSNENSEFKTLRHYNLDTGKQTLLTNNIPWDVTEIALSNDGETLAFVTNEDAISKLYLMDVDSFEYQKIDGLPTGDIGNLEFSTDNKQLAMNLNAPQTPGDVYVMDLNLHELTQWTYSEVGGLDTNNFATPELIHYPTFDQVAGKHRTIPAFVYKPVLKEAPSEGYPVMIYIHGGPEAQFNPGFISSFQYYLNEMGIAVIAPNVRGSRGYGSNYLELDNGYLREDSVKDIGALLDWIETQPDLDPNRICVYGGSYGGYMVLASMIHYNDRIACGVESVGISNFVTFLENTKPYRRDLRRVEYGDERDPQMNAFLQNISPTNHADKITKPLFVIQGFNDPRVPAGEAEQIVAIVRKNGGNPWYLLAMDEGHGFRKKSNRDYMRQAMVLFLEENLLK